MQVLAGASPHGSDAEIGRTWPCPVRLWQRSSGSHTHARADALTGAKMPRCSRRRRCSRTQNHTNKPARTHTRTNKHPPTNTHTRALTHTHSVAHTDAHTHSVTHAYAHTQMHTHRCTQSHTHRKTRIRPAAQPSRHAIAAVCHTHAFEGSDRCATFIDRIIGKTRASPVGPVQDAQARGSKQSHDPSRHRRVTNGT